ncbi:hypothetical protein E1301_Tti006879 [Triplophysa tibetana]|uniref:Uncharacterized protein n=1 Tax=Triplophysa tibetana TaxID=1572043 RepID=A0A5A9MZZ5_9TELE|nr:hypothetical protein E1301_Tti006879 [Triplophysa tibetana]
MVNQTIIAMTTQAFNSLLLQQTRNGLLRTAAQNAALCDCEQECLRVRIYLHTHTDSVLLRSGYPNKPLSSPQKRTPPSLVPYAEQSNTQFVKRKTQDVGKIQTSFNGSTVCNIQHPQDHSSDTSCWSKRRTFLRYVCRSRSMTQVFRHEVDAETPKLLVGHCQKTLWAIASGCFSHLSSAGLSIPKTLVKRIANGAATLAKLFSRVLFLTPPLRQRVQSVLPLRTRPQEPDQVWLRHTLAVRVCARPSLEQTRKRVRAEEWKVSEKEAWHGIIAVHSNEEVMTHYRCTSDDDIELTGLRLFARLLSVHVLILAYPHGCQSHPHE